MGKTPGNRRLYIAILRGMTPEQRLRKAFELTGMVIGVCWSAAAWEVRAEWEWTIPPRALAIR